MSQDQATPDIPETEQQAATLTDDALPAGDSPPRPAWPLYTVSMIWVLWIIFLILMVMMRINATSA